MVPSIAIVFEKLSIENFLSNCRKFTKTHWPISANHTPDGLEVNPNVQQVEACQAPRVRHIFFNTRLPVVRLPDVGSNLAF